MISSGLKQINSQSDLISMSSFASLSYLTIRSSVCIILICIYNLHNLCQTGSSYKSPKRHQQCVLNFNEQITRVHFLLLQSSIRPIPAQIILLWKGLPKLCIECHLVSLVSRITWHATISKVMIILESCQGVIKVKIIVQ